jgi:uncharacterized membrane protein
MNLDLFPLGWVHLVASFVTVAAGFLVLLRPKGTPVHRRRGRVYALALLVTSVTALGIHRRGIFFFPHWLAIAALIVTTVGVLAAHFKVPRRAWLHVHLTCLLTTLYLLVGGGVNEVPAGRRPAPAGSDPQFPGGQADPRCGGHGLLGAHRVLQCHGAAEVANEAACSAERVRQPSAGYHGKRALDRERPPFFVSLMIRFARFEI